MKRTSHALLLNLLAITTMAVASAADSCYTKKGTWAESMAATREKFLRTPEGAEKASSAGVFEPYDSGSIRGDGPAHRVSVNIAGVQVLRLHGYCEKGTANCNIWGEPKLISKDGKEVLLTTLTPEFASVGWGKVLTNKNWQDHALKIGERQFATGIWVHADSELRYKIGGAYERFEAYFGEDSERANGSLRCKVLSGDTVPAPSFWADLAGDFPTQAGWFTADAGADSLGRWFRNRDNAEFEQDIINRALRAVEPRGQAFRQELAALSTEQRKPGDERWLTLYARISRYRDIATLLKPLAPAQTKALDQELDALAASGTTAEDSKWQALRARLVQFSEIDEQYKTLAYDIAQRAKFEKHAKEAQRPEMMVQASDRDPLDVVLRRTEALLGDLKNTAAAAKLAVCAESLAKLKAASATTDIANADARKSLFAEACALRRQIAFANPLLDFDKILFVKRHRAIYDHMCDQYYGICANPGGGLYVLQNPFAPAPQLQDMLANSVVEKGRLQGQRLLGGPSRPPKLRWDGVEHLTGDEAQGGSFLSPDVSYDGKQILFCYVECKGGRQQIFHTDPTRGHWDQGRAFHVFKVNADGSHLEQITDGTWNDLHPCWLPNDRVAFITERRGGYLRCGRACPLYNLYDMAADGSQINCLSFHESNEWSPTVTNDGRIIYTRWDYVDRYGCIAHHPWVTTLDGTDSRALHGNFSTRALRADMELNVRPIPNSQKFVATGAPHHGQAYGSLVMIDARVADDDAMGPVKRLTPEVGFPESQGGAQVYGTPWPLSEDYFLCVYDATMQPGAGRQGGAYVRGNYGIYLLDSFGNKELLYRDPEIACMSPMPLRPRAKPTVVPSPSVVDAKLTTAPVEPGATGQATLAVVNVYDSLRAWPEASKIKELRVYQLLPMSVPSGYNTPHNTGKRITGAGDSVVPARWVLGTVPVEADGSAHFSVPANRELFFQALDEKGEAIQSMRSATYLRNGERLVCQGCHEPKHRTPPAQKTPPLAMQRAPSVPKPDVDGSNPFSYPRLVQPVLEEKCVGCHVEKKACNLGKEPIKNKWYASYNSLINFGFTDYHDDYRTHPGRFGAKDSKLMALLEKGHYNVKLTTEERHRITLWLDSSSMFYGVFEKEGGEVQLTGGVPKPTLE